MKLKVIASGSSGNCYILSSPTGSLLLECGVPWGMIQKGLKFDLANVIGCLVTHEHNDHSKAAVDVMNAGIDVYMSMGTAKALGLYGEYFRLCLACSKVQLNIKDFAILPFNSEHDAAEPLGFLIQYRPTGEKILFLTDSYYSKYRFKGLNYIMIECNYILDTLDWNIEHGYINEAMKPRLLQSHFSLEHVKQFLRANNLSQCREIILLHLSENNSDAGRMVQEIRKATGIEPKMAAPGLEVPLELYPY